MFKALVMNVQFYRKIWIEIVIFGMWSKLCGTSPVQSFCSTEWICGLLRFYQFKHISAKIRSQLSEQLVALRVYGSFFPLHLDLISALLIAEGSRSVRPGANIGSLTVGVTVDVRPTCVFNFPPLFLGERLHRRNSTESYFIFQGRFVVLQNGESIYYFWSLNCHFVF